MCWYVIIIFHIHCLHIYMDQNFWVSDYGTNPDMFRIKSKVLMKTTTIDGLKTRKSPRIIRYGKKTVSNIIKSLNLDCFYA